jgi:hypothetical protein
MLHIKAPVKKVPYLNVMMPFLRAKNNFENIPKIKNVF